MAATSISFSPVRQKPGIMPSRRIPLSSVPNAVNSPYRSVPAGASKRSRLEHDAQEEFGYNQLPPAKRQAVENAQARFRTPPRKQTQQYSEERFTKRTGNPQSTAFERKLLAAKERQSNYKIERQEKAANGIRQWQKHYRRVFPYFVFYFENIPDDVRGKYSKFVRVLGAKEEKFFSKDITHVITIRDIPGENESNSPTENFHTSSIPVFSPAAGQPRTIDPSILERPVEPLSHPPQTRNKFIFEKSLGRKPVASGLRESEPRRQNASHVDILSKAREMGMKIWQLEKLQRIMNSMFENSTDSNSQQPGRNARNMAGMREERGVDLSRMLRNEQLNGPSDRDTSVISLEFVPFKGPYIYIRDMDEKTKPIILKEYPNVEHADDGEWPQFRSVSIGKCPFIEENSVKSSLGRAKSREEVISKENIQPQPRTRAVTAPERCQGPQRILSTKMRQNQPLAELRNVPDPIVPALEKRQNQNFCAPPPPIPCRKSPVKGLKNLSAIVGPRMFGGEPAASGLQHSNLTSAIRSQIISSTAEAPGGKAGTSKEIQELKRKVLVRNSGPSLTRIQTFQRISHPSRTESTPVTRQMRKKFQENLIHIDEELAQSEAEEEVWRAEEVARVENHMTKSAEKKDSKPGYCENCRDKYDNFDEHVLGKEHKRFALTRENWRELDKLLMHLGRRLKADDPVDF